MKTKRNFHGAGALRLKAETTLGKEKAKAAEPSTEEMQKLVHELQVHEIELRMQNEELLRAQQEIETASERYSLLYEFAPCAYLTLTRAGTIREGNFAAATILEVQHPKLIGRKFTDFLQSESQDSFYLFCRQMQHTAGAHSVELDLKVAGKKRQTVQATGFKGNTDGLSEFRLALLDITPRKEAQEAVEQSERNLAAFFDQAPIGLQWLAPNGIILRANRAQLDLQGYAGKEYVGRRLADFVVDPEIVDEMLRRLSDRETLHNCHATLKHRDGSLRQVLMDATVHWQQDKVLYFSIFTRDISYRKDLEQKILEISEREQKRIAQDLHDDLGQILTAALYLTGALQKRLATNAPPREKEAAKILECLDRALTQTRGLARGLHPVRPESNGLMSALEELAVRTAEVFRRECVLICSGSVYLDDNVLATHLYRIAQEAVTNAIKHGNAQRIEIELGRVGGRVLLKITDNGTGLIIRETGMGLRIMQYRTTVIKGSWTIQPGATGGTVVTCSVPLSKARRSAI